MVYLIITMLLILLMILVSLNLKKFMDTTVYRKVKDMDYVRQKELERGLVDQSFLDSINEEIVEIKSNDGLDLKGRFIEGNENKDKVIVISHGITSGIPASYKYARPFIERGWSVLLIYHRRHVESQGKFSTLGYYEKYDLSSWIDYVKNRVKDISVLGIHGESMGASTALLTAGMRKDVDFVVADCGFSSLHELMMYKSGDKKMPGFAIKFVYSYVKIRAKFDMREVNPLDAIKDSGVPVLFIHGDEDKFVPTFMSRDMYKATKGYKELLIVPEAKHAMSINTDYRTYKERMMTFVDRVIQIKREPHKF